VVGVPDRDDFDPADLEGLRSPAVAADEWAVGCGSTLPVPT